VIDVIIRKPELTKISFLAHSVGGLAARYAIAKLYRHPSDTSKSETKGTIGGLEAMNFITVATPHLGSRGNNQVLLMTCFYVFPFHFDSHLSSEFLRTIRGMEGVIYHVYV
jgi:triacylglycerol esterase/lipase EstA (alpha/beta hydrolase family)